MNLLNRPLEIENPSFRCANKHPTVFAEVVQKPLRAFSPVLRTSGVVIYRQVGNLRHFILPLGDVWRGATTGQKQNAGREYECDGFFHGVILVTGRISVRVPQNPRSAILRCESSPIA